MTPNDTDRPKKPLDTLRAYLDSHCWGSHECPVPHRALDALDAELTAVERNRDLTAQVGQLQADGLLRCVAEALRTICDLDSDSFSSATIERWRGYIAKYDELSHPQEAPAPSPAIGRDEVAPGAAQQRPIPDGEPEHAAEAYNLLSAIAESKAGSYWKWAQAVVEQWPRPSPARESVRVTDAQVQAAMTAYGKSPYLPTDDDPHRTAIRAALEAALRVDRVEPVEPAAQPAYRAVTEDDAEGPSYVDGRNRCMPHSMPSA